MQRSNKRIVFRQCKSGAKGKIGNRNYIDNISSNFKKNKLDFLYCDDINYSYQSQDIVVNVINEDKELPILSDDNTIVCNKISTAHLLSNKVNTLKRYTENGIVTPQECNWSKCRKCLSFSPTGSNEEVKILDRYSYLDAKNHNVDLIDTRHEWNGKTYHTSLRLLSVCGEVIDIWLRLRTGKEFPIVHSKNTPLDSKVLNFLHQEIIECNKDKLENISKSLSNILGLGFFAHDLLVDTNNKFYVCESGFKFDDETYRKHLSPIMRDLQFGENVFNPKQLAKKSSDSLIKYLEKQNFI